MNVALQQKYNMRYMDYGYPGFGGRRRFRWGWGWPKDVDVWRMPYTDSTLIIDIIDGQTHQMIWLVTCSPTVPVSSTSSTLTKTGEPQHMLGRRLSIEQAEVDENRADRPSKPGVPRSSRGGRASPSLSTIENRGPTSRALKPIVVVLGAATTCRRCHPRR